LIFRPPVRFFVEMPPKRAYSMDSTMSTKCMSNPCAAHSRSERCFRCHQGLLQRC
jgi:hypothetical protein